MERAFYLLLRLGFAVLILGGLAIFFLVTFLSRSIPDYDDDLQVTGLQGDVEIVRSTYNIPHIFADADEDVMFGLGFAHAQDRLWQMTMLRRTAQGRLSEVFGRDTLQIDMLMRRLDLYRLASQSVSGLHPQTKRFLDAYAKGVNAWISEINTQARGRGAPEFFVFSNAIAPWQAADSLAVIKVMGVQFSSHLEEEVLKARLSLILDADRVQDLMPDTLGRPVAELPNYASLVPDVTPSFAALPQSHHPLSPVKPRAFAGASNAWAAAKERSAAGASLLANDPHLGLTAPTIWYLARLDLSSGGVIGGTIPGIPAVLVGRSAKLGWGLTSSYVDDQDLYIEQLEPNTPDNYLTPTGYKPFETRQSIIRIKDDAPVTLQLRWTENGPVLPGSHYDLKSITPANHVVSLAWPVLTAKDTSMDAMVGVMRAQDITGALEASERFIGPSQNLTLADAETVAMKTIGALPKRDPAHQSQGRIPSPGWIAQNRWQGIFAPDSNPVFWGEDGGIVGNTNNKVIDRPFPDHLSFTWGDTQRVQRWERLMQNRKVHTRGSFIEAQLDTVSPTARSLLPLMGKNLWFEAVAAEVGSADARRQEALKLLANWNGEMNEHLPEPLLFSAWLRALQQRLIQDELGPLAASFQHPEPHFIEKVLRNVDGASKWCDILQSAPIETCEQIARVALEDALNWLDDTYGGTVAALRWGDAHMARHDHPVLGNVPVLNWFVNIRQSTSGGDNTLMRGRTSGDPAAPFMNVHAAGYRGVYDFSDPDSSVFAISTGQSGHPLSRHYEDIGELWRRGEYINMSLDPDLARAGAEGITVLRPKDGAE